MDRLWSLAAVATALVLTACGGESPEGLVASAKDYLAKGEVRTAIIELKTALQKRPDGPEIRFMLGKALLEAEDPVGATVELRKALDLGHPRNELLPLLAKAMLQQGQHKQVLVEFANEELDDRASQAALWTTIGLAHVASAQQSSADAAFARALEAVPNHVPTMVIQARLLAVRGQPDDAMKMVDALIERGASDADMWALKGDLLRQRGDGKGAVAAYKKALDVSNAHLAAHAALLTIHFAERDLKAAGEQLEALKRVRASHPTTLFFRAQLAYENRDFKTAKEIVAALLKGAPDNPMANQLAGAVELASGSPELARAHLNKALAAMPNGAVARRLHASASLRLGDPSKALAMLEPLLALDPPDSLALTLAGEAHMQNRDINAAGAAFAKAAQRDPSAANQTALARTRLMKGDAGAIDELRRIAAGDPGTAADLELINALIRRRDFAAAHQAIDAFERKAPTGPTPFQLRAIAYLGADDKAKARASFEKALMQSPAFFPAAAGLASLDTEAKDLKAAQQRFEAVLKAQPGHLRAMLALANARQRNGATPQQVADVLGEAVRLNADQPTAHLALISHLMRTQQIDQALVAAQRAEAALPNNPQIVDTLGRVQLAAGQQKQAISSFNKLATMRPDQPSAHERIADASMMGKDQDVDAAIKSYERAVALKPDPARLARLFALQLRAGHPKEALAIARDVQKREPAQSIGFVLEGDALRALKSNDAAQAAYRKGMEKAAPALAAMRLHGLFVASGKPADAAKLVQSWQKDRPGDTSFPMYLGDVAIARGDFAAAETAYLQVLDAQPANVVALNNVAVAKVRTNKRDALPYAEKALALKPDDPALLDTLAMALAADKQIDKALEVQKKALGLAPTNPTLQFGLARIYAQAGQKKQARELLEQLDALGEKFRDHAQVKSLLATL